MKLLAITNNKLLQIILQVEYVKIQLQYCAVLSQLGK